jgi:hypothetical protein
LIFDKDKQTASLDKRWVVDEIFVLVLNNC